VAIKSIAGTVIAHTLVKVATNSKLGWTQSFGNLARWGIRPYRLSLISTGYDFDEDSGTLMHCENTYRKRLILENIEMEI